jgi:hypothetical protein
MTPASISARRMTRPLWEPRANPVEEDGVDAFPATTVREPGAAVTARRGR